MMAREDEKFEFRSHMLTEGAVETWMTNVENEMQRTLHMMAKEAVFNYAKV